MSYKKADSSYQVYDTTSVQREFEDRILNYSGNDPLEVWWHYITFLEQCVKSSSDNKEVREKLRLVVSRCCELFFRNPAYKNDERLVQVYIKQIQQVPSEKHLSLLQQMLNRGFGQMVSLMYLHIAAAIEIEEGPASLKSISVLEQGIRNNAQPLHLLFDAIREMEMRNPENFHNSNKHFDSSSSAQVKRESFAIPRMTPTPENHKEKLKTEQKEHASSIQLLNEGKSSLVKESPNIEGEKGLIKTESNSSIQVETSSSTNHSSSTPWKIMYLKDKLKLGTPSEITFDHLRAQKYLNKRGLQTPIAVRDEEKKMETMKQLEKVKVDLAVENEILAKERENDDLKKKVKEYEVHFVQLMEKQQKDNEIIKQNNIFIEEMERTISEMKLASERQVGQLESVLRGLEKKATMSENEILKAKQDNIELQILLRQEKETVNEILKEKEEMRKNFEEEKLKMQQNFDRERNESLLNFSQRLEQSLARQEIEQSLGLASESKKYGNVTNNSFVGRQQQQQSQYGEINSIKYSPPPCRTPAPKLPFSLYESNFEMTAAEEYSMSQAGGKSITSFPQNPTAVLQQQQQQQDQENIPPVNNENEIPSTNFKIQTETPAADVFAMPAPRPRVSITKQNNNKVALSNVEVERKQIRSENETVVPHPLLKDDNSMDLEDEEDIILKGQEETGIDFNVSDLTTNLRFARPLVNSTPEKSKVPFSYKPSGMMVNMPLSFDGAENSDRFIPVKRLVENRKSKLFRAFAPPPPPPPVPLFHEEEDEQQQEDEDEIMRMKNLSIKSENVHQQQQQRRLVIYEDEEEVKYTEDKENFIVTTNYDPGNTHYPLSPISETSKERWSSHSSGSGNSHNTS